MVKAVHALERLTGAVLSRGRMDTYASIVQTTRRRSFGIEVTYSLMKTALFMQNVEWHKRAYGNAGGGGRGPWGLGGGGFSGASAHPFPSLPFPSPSFLPSMRKV